MLRRKWLTATVGGCGLGIVVMGLLVAGRTPGADEVTPLQQAFIQAPDVKARYELADRLLALGDPAVPFLAEVLNTPKHDDLFPTEDVRLVFRSRLAVKMAAFRTPAAAAALQGYWQGGRRRIALQREGLYEPKGEGPKLVAQARDEAGATWALTPLWWYGRGDLWLIHSTDGKAWSWPVFTGFTKETMPPMEQVIARRDDFTRDTDQDGLYDVEERRFGTNPAKADTDGDGLRDGEDANPLVAPQEHPSDLAQTRQAVFTYLARDYPLIVVVTPDEERQEFLVRYHTVVLHVSPETPLAQSLRPGPGTVSALVFEEWDHGDNPRPLGVDVHGLKACLAASFDSRGALFELEKQHGAWVITGLPREWVY